MAELAFERRWRDALLDAMIPEPGNGLPPMAGVDRRCFWPRFSASAPWTVRAGLRLAVWMLGGVAPFLLGYRRPFSELEPSQRDDVLQRAAVLPGGGQFLLVLKLIACFAYFDDPEVQRVARSEPAR